jgi:hypothetical protein
VEEAGAALGKFDYARRYVADAMNSIETNKEKWFEAEVNRVAGEIAVKSPPLHTAKAEGYFERALAVARQRACPETRAIFMTSNVGASP